MANYPFLVVAYTFVNFALFGIAFNTLPGVKIIFVFSAAANLTTTIYP